MTVLVLDCKSGISGDMFSGALLDLGVDPNWHENELSKLNLPNYKIKISKVKKNGVKATKFDVIIGNEHAHRYLADINKIINESNLEDEVKLLAVNIFYVLAKSESKVHGTPIEKVYFHEVGAIDSVVDIISASILINKLKIERILFSNLSEGQGKVKIAHGLVDLPVPCTKELIYGFPLHILNINSEMITPTGAAILKATGAIHIDSIPQSKNKGVGAGTKEFDFPNILEAYMFDEFPITEKTILETNIDDMSPEIFPYVIERLIGAGAIDAHVTPSEMKKGRHGILLTVICDESKKDELLKIIFTETTTIGIRINRLNRVELDRKIVSVKTKYGKVNVKVAYLDGKPISVKPEFEDCKRIAVEQKIPLKEIMDAASALTF